MALERLRTFAYEAPRGLDLALMALILLAGLGLLGPGLGHPSIHNWDESAHQATTRGTADTFFRPHIYDSQVYAVPPNEWLQAGVFLHKPTGPFWFGAAAMHVFGVTPLALRLGSFIGELAAALALYWLTRRVAVRPLALAAAVVWLALPFGYELCQGYIFGDATDCTLVGWVVMAMALLVGAIERDDARLAALAGAATGAGYLCKTALALVPLGVALAFAVLGSLGWLQRLRWKSVALFVVALVLLAAPWNIYTAFAFPDVYHYEARVTLAHLFTAEFAQWVRPWDGIFNEINETELGPMPPAVALIALVWASWRAVRRRETTTVALTLWVAATWLVLSVAKVKVPATAWGAVPGALALIAMLLADAAKSATLGGATTGAALSTLALHLRPQLAQVARSAPGFFEQSRTHPALLLGLLMAIIGAAIGFLLARVLGRFSFAKLAGIPAMGLISLAGIAATVVAQRAHATELNKNASIAPMRELGLALDQTLPKQSLIFLGVDRDPSCCFDVQDLMFWSGRMVYRKPPDLGSAASHGLHPYLVSVAAEPYVSVPGVPAFSMARAYDLLAAAPPPTIPADARPLDIAVPNAHVLGWAAGRRDTDHDVWAFYVQSDRPAFQIPLAFTTRDGVVRVGVSSGDTLSSASRWMGKPWFVVTALGPHREDVSKLQIGDKPVF